MASVRHIGLFPFCVGSYPPKFKDFDGSESILDTGPRSPYPIALPKRYATRLWWTVKHWTITGTYYYYRTLAPTGYEEITGQINVATTDSDFTATDFVSRILADGQNEKKLVCQKGILGGQRSFQWTIELDRVSDTGSGQVQSTTTSPLNLDIGGARFQTGYAPQIVKSPAIENQPLEFWINMAVSFGSWSSESPFQDRQASCEFNLLGLTKPIPLYAVDSDATETLDLTLQPSEFWEYNPGDDKGPIYEKTTGATLR